MQKFSKIFEEAELVSGEYKELKKLILDKIEDKTDLKASLINISKGFNNEIPSPFTTEELHDIWRDQVNSIDAVLAANNWFEDAPAKTGIKSTMIYVIESTKRAFKLICDILIAELPK